MTLSEIISTCESSLLIWFYNTGAETPKEEVDIAETLGYEERQQIIADLEKKYPKSHISSFWCLNEDTIAVSVCV